MLRYQCSIHFFWFKVFDDVVLPEIHGQVEVDPMGPVLVGLVFALWCGFVRKGGLGGFQILLSHFG